MAYVREHRVAVVTDGSGDGVGYTTRAVTGRIEYIRYVKTDFADGVDFDVTLETSGIIVWAQDNVNAAAVVWPRTPLHSTAGVALTYDGTYPVTGHVYVAGERVKIVVAQGGNTKSGTFYVGLG